MKLNKSFRPLGKRVLVRPIPVPESIGGVLLPDNVKGRHSGRAEVIASGLEDVKVGDIIHRTLHFEHFLPDAELLLLEAEHVLAVEV